MSNTSTGTADLPSPGADLDTIKARQRVAWATGDYAVVGTTLQIVGEDLCEAIDLHAGVRVLDVAAGNGNVSLAAARRWCDVVATDYVPALLERARERAVAERLTLDVQEADAEALPFPDESFDAVVSTFGVMFTPNQERAAMELIRTCKPGGKIGLANWTPRSFVGQLFKMIGTRVPPAPGVRSPALWGTRERIAELFQAHASSIDLQERSFTFRYRSPQHLIDVLKTFYGPVNKTFAALTPADEAVFTGELLELIARFNRSGDDTAVVPSEYLEVVITRA